MGRGNTSNFNDGSTLFIFRVKGLRLGDKAHFQVTKKDGNEYIVKDDDTSVFGRLIKIETKDDSYEENKFKVVKLFLKDDVVNELYIVEGKMNNMMRGIINNLANIPSFDGKILKLSLWNTKEEGYARCTVRVGDEIVKWKYEWAKFADMIIETDGFDDNGKPKKIKHFHKLDEWLLTDVLLGDIAKKLEGVNRIELVSQQTVRAEDLQLALPNAANLEEETKDAPNDDLPF